LLRNRIEIARRARVVFAWFVDDFTPRTLRLGEWDDGVDMDVVRKLTRPQQIAEENRRGAHRSSRVRLIVSVLAGGFGLVVWCGSNRVPADPTEPLVLQGAVEHESLPGRLIRVGTFNIHGGKGRDGHFDLDRTAACLADLDLAGLNEVHGDWLGRRRNQAAELGRKSGMAWLFAPTERRWWHNHFGNGLLTKVALTGFHRIPLPTTQSRKYRCAVLAGFQAGGQKVQVLTVHIDRVRDRETQLQAVIDLFLSLDEPAILMGDLNTTAHDPHLKRLLSLPGVSDAVGEGLDGRVTARRIDWIITRGCRCVRAEYRATDASDHPFVRAELIVNPSTRQARAGRERSGP